MQSSLWDKMIPRFVAVGGFAYLVYDLVWQKANLNYLHILVFLLIVVLVLVPFARRLKIPNVIEFESKLESLREETRTELVNIRNQISITLEAQISPVQHQWTVIGMGEPSVKQLAQSIVEQFRRVASSDIKKDDKYTRDQFLRRTDSYRARAYDVLFITYHLQMALQNKRLAVEEEDGDFLQKTMDERIDYFLGNLLSGGIELFVPPSEVSRISECLKALMSLLDIRNKVDSREVEPPDEQEAEILFDKLHNALGGIIAGVVLQGSNSILYRYEIMQKLEELRAKFGIEDSPKKE